MRSLTHLTLLCAASSAGASVLRPRLDALIDELGDALGEVVDDVVDGIKVIISKIPLSEFGQMAAVHLQDVIKDPSLIDSLYAALPSSDQAATRDLEGTVPRAAAVSTRQAAASTCDDSNLSTRVEWRDYTPEDRIALVDAMACLITTPSAGPEYAPSTSRYEDLVRTHQLLTNEVHMNGVFLLWHRYYLHAFETALRADCGFDRPLPWWDETLDAGAFNQSSVFTPELFGSLPSSVDGSGVCVTDGRFANLTCNIGPGSDSTPHCLSRAGDESMTAEASQEFVEYCAVQYTVFGEFSRCAETGYVFFCFFPLFLPCFFFSLSHSLSSSSADHTPGPTTASGPSWPSATRPPATPSSSCTTSLSTTSTPAGKRSTPRRGRPRSTGRAWRAARRARRPSRSTRCSR